MSKQFWYTLAVGFVGMLLGAGLIYGLVAGADRAQMAPMGPQAGLSTSAPLPTLGLAPAMTPTRLGSYLGGADPSAVIAAVQQDKETLTVRVTVSQIPGDYLFEPPVLRTAAGDLAPTMGSLKAMRTDLLRLITDGTVTSSLAFPVTDATGSGLLIFNPSRTDAALVSPHLEVPVSWPLP